MVKQLLLQTWSNIKCGQLNFIHLKITDNGLQKWWFRNNGIRIPSSIGAKLANPDKTVVCFVGDGGFQMTNQEMALLPEYGLDVKIVLINNGNTRYG